uniref:Large ribosomal subunit protein mL40 n=1 Tax=Strigamia maritima TaxID=126957 RepID=T1J6N9_STRMM
MLRLKFLPQILIKQNIKWCCDKQIHTQNPLYFQATQILSAEPMKKKKRVDPMLLKKREERRVKKIEKQIKILSRHEKQPKPVEELELDRKLIEEKEVRARVVPPLLDEEVKRRITLKREWSDYKRNQFLAEFKCAKRLIATTDRALKQLRSESEDLYQEAIQLDPFLLPFSVEGPVETPPIANYDPADGCYIDQTRVWTKRSVLPTMAYRNKKNK